MQSRHIVVVLSGLGAGGAEAVVAQLAKHWIAQGHTIAIVTFDDPAEPVFHDFPEDAQLVRLGRPERRGPFASLRSVVRKTVSLRHVTQHQQPDAVLSFLTKNNLLALLAAIGTSVPVICSERNNPERQNAHPLWTRMLRIAYRSAALIVCQTSAVRRCLPMSVQSKVVVIPNPIVVRGQHHPSRDAPRLAAVGRLTRQKGFDLLLEAFARLPQSLDDWSLDIWGEGEERERLADMIGKLGLEGRAALNGLSTRPGSWIAEADLFVLPSRYEGFPNALGEAMAAGLPVVATKCDFGPAEIVTHDHDGLLVSPEDPDSLALGLSRLMGDAMLRERLGCNAAISATRYAPDRILAMWDEALAQAVGATDTAKEASASRQSAIAGAAQTVTK